jgi:Ca-activated chloride channel family protein
MKKYLTLVVLLPFLFVVVGWGGEARQEQSADKTLSPYFFVKSDDPATDRLPLKSTSARAFISGVIADVTVTQVYKNEGTRPLEAIYVFPASTRAAVYGMKMTVGERVIIARIKKRDEARQEYERARQAGQSASLLEQQRPNVFQMNVANIMPGDTITVELKYNELLAPEDKVYAFIYPTVVGPRYSNQPAETAPAHDRWIANPYLHQGEAPSHAFDITVDIAAGLPVRDITCSSHRVQVKNVGPETAAIKLDPAETKGGNRDYILKYRLGGDRVQSGLLLSEGKNENFFLLMLQPPKWVALARIPGREYIFIVDVSGSMHGYPIEVSKKLLKDLIGRLRPTDTFNVLLFAGGNSVMAEQSLPATPENITKAIALIGRQQGGGATELLPALRRALRLPRTDEYSRTIVIATDGYVSVEAEAFDRGHGTRRHGRALRRRERGGGRRSCRTFSHHGPVAGSDPDQT